jgi:pyrimidine-specific ribonucleoside hydrolase
MQKIDLWLDCDPGHDDMMAIILAVMSDSFNLHGISTVAGNNTLKNTTANALKTLQMLNYPKIPVYPGSAEAFIRGPVSVAEIHGETGLDGVHLPPSTIKPAEGNLYIHLRQVLLNSPGKMVLVATGPFTNYAILIQAFPEVIPKIEKLVVMGGAWKRGNWSSAAEFNIVCDPEACQMLCKSKIPIVMMPLEVTHKVLYDEKLKESWFKIARSPFLDIITGLLDFFQKAYAAVGFKGAAVHDPCTIAYLLDPTIFVTKDVRIATDCASEYCDGRIIVYERPEDGPFNCKMGVDVNAEAFWKLMTEAVMKANAISPVNVKKDTA